MILFDIEAALARIAAQKPATVANPARPANPPAAASPEPAPISGISGISGAGTLCAEHHDDLLAEPADPDDDRPPIRPADGRVQDAFGAWRTPAAHEAIRAFYAHHWHCDRCIRAGRGYGDRCEAGERLHAAMRAAS